MQRRAPPIDLKLLTQARSRELPRGTFCGIVRADTESGDEAGQLSLAMDAVAPEAPESAEAAEAPYTARPYAYAVSVQDSSPVLQIPVFFAEASKARHSKYSA